MNKNFKSYFEYRMLQLSEEERFTTYINEVYIPLNIWSIKVLGLDAAVMLAALYDEYIFREKRQFKFTVTQMTNLLGFGATRQRKAIEVLVDRNLIKCEIVKERWDRGYRAFELNFGSDAFYKLVCECKEVNDEFRKEKSIKEFVETLKECNYSEDEIVEEIEKYRQRLDEYESPVLSYLNNKELDTVQN